jgi:dihydroneopterin aldolase
LTESRRASGAANQGSGGGLDTIFIEQLAVDAVIGVYDWEREITQRLFIDLDIGFTIRDAAADDDVDQTLDYQAVAERVQEFVAASRYRLIETLAEEIARLLIADFDVLEVGVRVSKPGALPQAANVGVRVTRSREV